MKRLAIVAGMFLSGTLPMLATPACVAGTLSDYEVLGAAGCSIGSNTVFSFRLLTGITGAIPFDPATLMVTPSGGTNDPGLMFAVNQIANLGQIFDSLISYQIKGNIYQNDSISLSNTSRTGNGAVTDIQNYCANGTFGANGVSGCSSGVTGDLLTFGNGSDGITFGAGVNMLSLTDDLTIDGGGSGSASGGTIFDQLTASSSAAVPEPSTFGFGVVALLLASCYRIRLYLPARVQK